MDPERIREQIEFIIEIDKLKNIYRRTYLLNSERTENDAEHSWHIALMAMVLAEYSNDKKINLLQVIKMLLIHDIVEIDAGDTFIYDEKGNMDKEQREQNAAERLFNILPEDQAKELKKLWEEFEKRETPEAKYAAVLDRLQPLLHNYYTQGKAWKEHGIHIDQVLKRNKHILEGSGDLWNYAEALIRDAAEKGYLKK